MKKLIGIFQIIFLTFILVLVGFGGIETNAASTEKNYENDYFTISYKSDEIQVLVNSDLTVFKNLKAADLTELKNNLVSVIYAAILDDLDFETTASGTTGSLSTPASSDVNMTLIANIICSQINTSEDVLEFVYGDKYDVVLEYYIDRYVDTYMKNNSGVALQTVLDKVSLGLIQPIKDRAQFVYGEDCPDAEITDKVNTIINKVKANKEASKKTEVDLKDVKEIINIVDDKDKIIDVIKELEVQEEIKEIVKNIDEDTVDDVVDFITDVPMDTIIEIYKEVEVSKEDVKNIISNVGSDNLIEIVDQVGIDSIKDLANEMGFTKEELKETITDSVSDISVGSLIKTLKSISIDENVIYENSQFVASGFKKVITELPKFEEIANFTDDEMKLSWNVKAETILGNVEFKLTIGLKGDCSYVRAIAQTLADTIDVSVVDGVYNVTINAPEKFTKLLLKLSNSNILSNEIKHLLFKDLFSTVSESYESITSKTLEEYIELLKGVDYQTILANLYNAEKLNSAFNTDTFTDDKLDKFVDDVFALVKKASGFTYNDVKELVGKYFDISALDGTAVEVLITKGLNVLKEIDDLSIDSKLIREFIALDSKEANQKVYNYIEKLANYEGYYNKAMSYLEKVYGLLPERVKDNSIVDFYKENGVINYSGNLPLNIESVLTSVSETYGQKVYDALSVIFDKLPESVNVSLTLNLKDVYKVTYKIDGEVVEGLLPAGADVAFFSNTTTVNGYKVLKWVDDEGVEYTEMPHHDVELTPVLETPEFSVAIFDGVTKTYDSKASELVCIVTPTNDYTYQWYKNGVLVDGANEAILNVLNVKDSGVYYCVVSLNGTSRKSNSVTVSIKKAEMTLPNLEWNYDGAFSYNGKEHKVELKNVPFYFEVSYEGNTGTKVGTYVARAIVKYNSSNYDLVDNVIYLDWEISKATIDASSLSWNYSSAYTYDGNEKEVVLKNVPSGVTVTYEGSKATNAGKYTAKASLVANDDNYQVSTSLVTLSWEISKATIDTSSLNWDYSSAYTYDGKEKEVVLKNVPSGVTVTYEGSKATAVGKYTAKASLVASDANYQVSNSELTLTWEIGKATIDTSKLSWDYTGAFTYDGTEKVVLLKDVPSDVAVTYEGNKATDAGKYTAKAKLFVLSDGNYQVSKSELTLSWEIKANEVSKKYEFELSEGNKVVVKITSKDGIDVNYDVKLEEVTDSDFDLSAILSKNTEGKVVKTYEIKFIDENGNEVKVNGEFAVQLLIPEDYRTSKNLKVVYVDGEGNVTEMTSSVSGDYIEFTTTHFSIYSIVEVTKTASHAWIIWLIIGLIVLAAIPAAYIIIKKYNK